MKTNFITKKDILFYLHAGYFSEPDFLQIEITDSCPLACPQCYKQPGKSKNIDFHMFKKLVDEADKIGVSLINLNGGEPLTHPDFLDMVEYITGKGILAVTYISGVYLEKYHIRRLSHIENFHLMISLNGSNKTVNNLSRDGFETAIKALEILSSMNFKFKCGINWVARHDNVNDLPDLLKLAKSYNVDFINVVCNKISHNGYISSLLDKNDYKILINIIKSNGSFFTIQNCFGTLLAQLNEINKVNLGGCQAGIRMCGINVDGDYFPCTHLNYVEKYDSIMEYWQNSLVLKKIRSSNGKPIGGNCEACLKVSLCRFCHATSLETHDNLTLGISDCPLFIKDNDNRKQEKNEE